MRSWLANLINNPEQHLLIIFGVIGVIEIAVQRVGATIRTVIDEFYAAKKSVRDRRREYEQER